MPGPTNALSIIRASFLRAAIFDPSDDFPDADASYGLDELNSLLDSWDADGQTITTIEFLGGWSNYPQSIDLNDFFIMPTDHSPLTIGQASIITSASLTSNVATYIAKNTYNEGDLVSTNGCTTSALNVAGQLVTSASPTQFTTAIVHADIPTESYVGAKAIYTTSPNDAFPDFATTGQRILKLVNGNIVLNNLHQDAGGSLGNGLVKCPLNVRDQDWWSSNTVPNITSTIPTDVWYETGWPNGRIHLWPVQSTDYGLELQAWVNLLQLTNLTSQFWLQQGYQDAIIYSLAEKLCPSYSKPLDPSLGKMALQARQRAFKANSPSPRMVTKDAGLPGNDSRKASFNWRSGLSTSR